MNALVIALHHVTLIDGTGAEPTPDATVAFRDGRIIYAGTAKTWLPSLQEDILNMDFPGKFLLPGLIDCHIRHVLVRRPAIRYILSYSLILATLGAALRLLYVLTGQSVHWLSLAAVMLTLGEMIFLCLFISSLVWFAVRRRGGKWVPDWVGPLVI